VGRVPAEKLRKSGSNLYSQRASSALELNPKQMEVALAAVRQEGEPGYETGASEDVDYLQVKTTYRF
jgi:hypothetical protein